MQKLANITASQTAIGGTLPASYSSQLPSLTVLEFQYCRLTGALEAALKGLRQQDIIAKAV